MSEIANAAVQMSDRLAGGNKSAVTAIERVGLNLGQLVASSPDKALLAVAHAAAQISNPMERVAFLTDAVGKAGAKTLLPMLDDLDQKWNTLGGTIDEQGIKSLDEAGDALAELGRVGTKFLADVLTPMAPAFTFLATSIGDFVSATIPKLQAWFNGVIEGFMRVELAFREFDDNMRNAGLRELDQSDPARAGAVRQLNGIAPGGGFNSAQLARDRLGAFQFQPPAGSIPSRSSSPSGGGFAPGASGRSGRGANMMPFSRSFANRLSLPYATGIPAFPGFYQEPVGASFQNFSGVGFAPTVGMNRPGGGGSGGSGRPSKAVLGMMAANLVAQYLPGRSGQVARGALGGAATGAMIGSVIPVIGTAAGAVVGAVVGGAVSYIKSKRAEKKAKAARSAETMQVFEQFQTEDFQQLQNQAEKLGISMNKALSAKTMDEFTSAVRRVNEQLQITNDLQAQIDSLTEQSTVGFDKMNAVVKEFGLDIGKMGPAFQQAALDKESQKIIDAFALMEKGGADMNGVLDGMQDEISKVVQDSVKFGTTIPENMRPWIEKLRESGRLVDENGQALTDTSRLQFGAPMASEMDKVVKKLDELIAKLAELTQGFHDAGRAAGGIGSGLPGAGDYNDSTTGRETHGASGFATGGVAGRDFRRPGYGDVFPALLRRGERVMPAGVGGGGITIGNLTVSGGYGSRADAVEEIGNAVVAYVERRGGRLVA